MDPARAIIGLQGEEARDFLHGLLTNSVLDVSPERPVFAALLTPQGKILHTLFVHAAPDGGLRLDVAAGGADDLIRRLTMFRLRRKIGIEDLRGKLSLALGEGAPDPRHPGLPARGFVEGPERADWTAYDSVRLALAVPDQGRDYGAEEIFPADANLDLLNGVDLKKGCFVGQEVVSRMHRKGGVRKRMCAIRFEGQAPEYGAQIVDETNADIGTVRSTSGQAGLALVRIDRLAQAQGALTANGQALQIALPERAPIA
jgi:folate-binding protein YgfZ